MTLVQHAADPKLTTLSTSWYIWRVSSHSRSTAQVSPGAQPLTIAHRQLLGIHPLTKTLPVTAKTGGIRPLYYVAGESEKNTTLFKAAVYNATEPVAVSLQFEGIEMKGSKATLTLLTGPEDPYAVNDPFTQINVVNETTATLTAGEGGVFVFSLPSLSVAVLETEGESKTV